MLGSKKILWRRNIKRIPQWISKKFQEPPLLFSSPLPLDKQGRIWFVRPPLEGSIFEGKSQEELRKKYEKFYAVTDEKIDQNEFNKIEEIGYASGTCLFTSSAVLKKVGLFDPFIFLYHDDLDLGWRASQLGIKSYYVPTSIIYHAESYSLKWNAEKFYWLERNRKYCILTHYSKQTYSKIFPRNSLKINLKKK